MPAESFVVTLADAAGPHEKRPPETRLRAVLKLLLLRGFGLRCVGIRPADPDEPMTITVDDNSRGGR
jgi:hypothetical protein